MTTDDHGKRREAGAFDIRTFIGTLLGIYGVILLLTGLFGTSEEALARADGLNVNIWTGLGLLVAAAMFLTWAKLRPVIVPASSSDDEGDGAPSV